MPATQAQSGFGSKFQIESTVGGGVFTTVTDVTSITAPDTRLDLEDATHMESPGGYEEMIPLLKRSDAVTVNGHKVFGDSTRALLKTAQDNREKRAFRIISPDSTRRIVFSGYVERIGGGEMPHDGKMTHSVTVKPTGQITEEANT